MKSLDLVSRWENPNGILFYFPGNKLLLGPVKAIK